jgi:hypothetical protein
VRLPWDAEVGAEVEQIVLDSRQHRLDREIGCIACIPRRKHREADGAIRLIDVAHGCDPCVALRTSGAIAEAGFALVPRARIDDVQLDHASPARQRVAAEPPTLPSVRVARRSGGVHSPAFN